MLILCEIVTENQSIALHLVDLLSQDIDASEKPFMASGSFRPLALVRYENENDFSRPERFVRQTGLFF